MLGAIDQGLSGITAAFTRLDTAARNVARDGAAGDPGKFVELARAGHDVRANVAAMRTADETVGSLLDLFA